MDRQSDDMSTIHTPRVRVVRPWELSSETAQTPGLDRWAAVSDKLTASTELWMGRSVLAPGLRTGVHHHGDSETALYVTSGVGRWWTGEEFTEPVEAAPGDFLFIPSGVVHWEENPSSTEPVEMIVARSTMDAIVVNLPHLLAGEVDDLMLPEDH